MNFNALKLLNGYAGKYYLLDLFMIIITHTGIFILLGMLFCTWNKKTILKGIISAVSAYLIDAIISLIYFTPRPVEGMFLISRKIDSSFPSTHTLISFSLAFTIYFYNKKLGIIALIIAAIVAISRIFLAMHYLIDVIGGIIIALLVCYIVERF